MHITRHTLPRKIPLPPIPQVGVKAPTKMIDHIEYSHLAQAAEAETYGSTTPPAAIRKRRSKDKRRFSDEQIKSMESIFERESRLEPVKKLQLAEELGLQPRQVAIWFQNKRARWKSKQLERDYSVLCANYNSLASRLEALKEEKQALLIELQKLNDLIQKPLDQTQSCTQVKAPNSMDSESENGDTIKCESEAKPSPSKERSEHVLNVLLDGDSSIKGEHLGPEDELGLLNSVEHADGSLTSPEHWGKFDSDDLLGQSTSDHQWWDFWS